MVDCIGMGVCQLLGGLECVVDFIGVRGVSTIRWSGMCG